MSAELQEDEERPDIQKKVFGRWINAKLKETQITDLYFDLQDVLLNLISKVAQKEVKHEQVILISHQFFSINFRLSKRLF